jgi:hypothetical protein
MVLYPGTTIPQWHEFQEEKPEGISTTQETEDVLFSAVYS